MTSLPNQHAEPGHHKHAQKMSVITWNGPRWGKAPWKQPREKPMLPP